MDNKLIFVVKKINHNIDIKDYLREMESLSGRFIRKAVRDGRVFVNKEKVIKKHKLSQDDLIEIYMQEDEHQNIEPEDMNIEIVYEDNDIIVINKRPGIVVHPTKGHPTGTLSNGILYHFKKNGEKSIVRLVSRLDRDTSGLIIIAKNQFSHMRLASDMSKDSFRKIYIAVVHGSMKEKEKRINLPIYKEEESESIKRIVDERGQESITTYKVLEELSKGSVVRLELETGRTHQIRVHMSHLGHPLYGDSLYGKGEEEKEYIERQALHAYKLEFPHPRTGDILKLQCSLPNDIKNLIEKIK
ncbi:RluA family pseudouridine synthase [Clostridium botulinum]|uniref:Pseudouridine synthase n=2 Tax=Clostridium botulinum TaxID=1491 RepID=A0A846I534_CLOBO|nr:RluA family pseudouridine synthase [Clostridium botulinum]AJD28895.1 pseudouridine synthase, RluA family protein [Clostridium botulinum CDC_297]EPS52914.1 RluA family pseudouridine synthase [Clostridium botulinum A1 str. CFSAN002368]ACQ52694.1 pseudouridine synthase, RluA family [Clostridium botulinum Ba4 str. 657]AJE11398.1 pseudouridine synthase, RluA family protein [Clostridium botulinum CDC_1436]APR01260.1 pseudouridine synthase, RluA family protein [Clostridium botulinum]